MASIPASQQVPASFRQEIPVLLSELRSQGLQPGPAMQGFLKAFASPHGHGFVPYQRPLETSGHETTTSGQGGPSQPRGSANPSFNTDHSVGDRAPGQILGEPSAADRCPRDPACVKPLGHMGRCLVRRDEQEYYVQDADDDEEEEDEEQVTEDELAAAEALAGTRATPRPQQHAQPAQQRCPRDPRCLNLPGHRGRCRIHPQDPPAGAGGAEAGPCLRHPQCVKVKGHKGMCRLTMPSAGAGGGHMAAAAAAAAAAAMERMATYGDQPPPKRRGRPPGSTKNKIAQERLEKEKRPAGASPAAGKAQKGTKRPARSMDSENEFDIDEEESEEDREESEEEEEEEEEAPRRGKKKSSPARRRSPDVRTHRNQRDQSPPARWVDKRPRRTAAAGTADGGDASPEVPRERSPAAFNAAARRDNALQEQRQRQGRRQEAPKGPKGNGRKPAAPRAPADRRRGGGAAADPADKVPAPRAPAPWQQRRGQQQQEPAADAPAAARAAAPISLEQECLQLESALNAAGVASYDRVTFLLRFTSLQPAVRAAQAAVLRGALAAGNNAAVVVAVRELCLAPGGSNS